MKICTANKAAWNVLCINSLEASIDSAFINVLDMGRVSLTVRSKDYGFLYNFPIITGVWQTAEDTILFELKDEENVAIVLEKGDGLEWIRQVKDYYPVKYFMNYCVLGQYATANSVYNP